MPRSISGLVSDAQRPGAPLQCDALLPEPGVQRSPGARIIFITGRTERIRDITEEWIRRYLGYVVTDETLLMRKDGDYRQDYLVKQELYSKFIESNPDARILCVLEDRTQVVKMWRAKGLTTLQVADGDF